MGQVRVNPQADEIAAARETYKPSEEYQAQKTLRDQQWREFVEADKRGEVPKRASYGGDIGEQWVMPTEAAILHSEDEWAEYEDMNRHLHGQIRFRADNVFFEVDMGNARTLDERHAPCTRSFSVAAVGNPKLRPDVEGVDDLKVWGEFLVNQVKPALDGKTWLEVEAEPTLGGLVDEFIRTSDRFFVYKAGMGYTGQISFLLWVGHPGQQSAWMV